MTAGQRRRSETTNNIKERRCVYSDTQPLSALTILRHMAVSITRTTEWPDFTFDLLTFRLSQRRQRDVLFYDIVYIIIMYIAVVVTIQ